MASSWAWEKRIACPSLSSFVRMQEDCSAQEPSSGQGGPLQKIEKRWVSHQLRSDIHEPWAGCQG